MLDRIDDESKDFGYGIFHAGLLTEIGLQNHALQLLVALQNLPASHSLPSGAGGKNLFNALFRLNLAVSSGDFDVRRVIPLIAGVLNHESDFDVWEKVYEFLAESTATTDAKPSTPPLSDPSRTASFQQTPWTFNTGSFADTSDLRRNVDPILKTEVEDNLRIDHSGVFATFFGKIPNLAEIATVVLQSCKEADPSQFQEGVGWAEWPQSCEEASVLRFLRCHIARSLLVAE